MKNKYLNINQDYTSAKTSIHHIPKLFKSSSEIKLGPVNLDYGCGKYANDYTLSLAHRKIYNLRYDPYNQHESINDATLNYCKNVAQPDTCTLSNVLCVIKEKSVRFSILIHIRSLVKNGGRVYISCYRGVGNTPGPTCNGWQNNQPLSFYLKEVKQIFPNSKISRGFIEAINN